MKNDRGVVIRLHGDAARWQIDARGRRRETATEELVRGSRGARTSHFADSCEGATFTRTVATDLNASRVPDAPWESLSSPC
jgi:hypothetical protein